ncbi:MAG: RNA polymerase sigma factor [Acetobacteraceae bacterium]|nr:RNA polymerase sigma factor [Acetobacteraceae bacterium]
MDHNPPAALAQDNVRAALAHLLPQLRAFARFLAGSRTEADDLVQEAVLRTLRALEDGRGPAQVGDIGGSLRPWCLAVIRNVFHEQLRTRRREAAHRARHAPIEAASLADDAPGSMRDLGLALSTLPPILREALVLVGVEGLSHEEAAAICHVPVGTMKARVSRARRQLATALDRECA